jgi:hypothetical protein
MALELYRKRWGRDSNPYKFANGKIADFCRRTHSRSATPPRGETVPVLILVTILNLKH